MDYKNLTLEDIQTLAEGDEGTFLFALQTLLAQENVENPLISFLLGARYSAVSHR